MDSDKTSGANNSETKVSQPINSASPVISNITPVKKSQGSMGPIQSIAVVGIIGAIIFVIIGVLFFDTIKEIVSPSDEKINNAPPSVVSSPPNSGGQIIDPNVICGRFTDLNTALENINQACMLDLSGQDLSDLPDNIVKLTKLTTLFLRDNNFNVIPEEIFKLSSLVELDLSNNNIVEIPDTIKNLENMEVINIVGNPVVENSSQMQKLSGINFVISSVDE